MAALPAGKAAAQGSQNGYAYTQRVCQEYGQQPRRYNVRDPIPGSDWRSDGGWAIVLVTSSAIGYRFGAPDHAVGGPLVNIENNSPRRELTELIDLSGQRGFVVWNSDGTTDGYLVIDLNNDGRITVAGDRYNGPNSNKWEFRTYTTEAYGASYIRWANMQWCR